MECVIVFIVVIKHMIKNKEREVYLGSHLRMESIVVGNNCLRQLAISHPYSSNQGDMSIGASPCAHPMHRREVVAVSAIPHSGLPGQSMHTTATRAT